MTAYITAADWIATRLASDPRVTAVVGDRIYEGAAPDGATGPVVVVQPYGDPTDLNAVGGQRVMTTCDIIVRVWDTAGSSTGTGVGRILPVAVAIDDLLHGTAPVTTAHAYIAGCVRTHDASTTVTSEGVIDRALGGVYRVHVAPVA